jgi:ATP-dependent exoDNAse (exonuclease V) beta subunit
MLERWDFVSDVQAVIRDLLVERMFSALAADSLSGDLIRVAKTVRENAFAQRILADSGLRRETPFMLRIEDALVSGVIDGILEDGTIIDYKTGQGPIEAACARSEHVWQLRLYAAASRELMGRVPPAAYAVYVDKGEAVQVEVSDQRIDEAIGRAFDAIQTLRVEDSSPYAAN